MEKKITIYDVDAERLAEIRENLLKAMNTLNSHYSLECMAEPPFLARMGVYGKLPVLEHEDLFWSWKVGESISEEAAVKFLKILGSVSK